MWFNFLNLLAQFLSCPCEFQEKSPKLWAFLIATYWVSFVAYYLMWRAYNHVSDLRAAALMSPEARPEQFTILVRDIPPPPEGQTRKEQVDSFFKAIYPDTYYKSMVVTNNKEVFNPCELHLTIYQCFAFLSQFDRNSQFFLVI